MPTTGPPATPMEPACANCPTVTPKASVLPPPCHSIYIENTTHIDESLKAVGIAFLAAQLLASAIAVGRTVVSHEKNPVKMWQPIFLVVVVVGCTIVSLGIVPLSVEANYQY